MGKLNLGILGGFSGTVGVAPTKMAMILSEPGVKNRAQ